MWAKWHMSDTKKSLPSLSSYKLNVTMKYLKKKKKKKKYNKIVWL